MVLSYQIGRTDARPVGRTSRGWLRVSRRNPCPVCGKPDWCLVSEDGTAAICPRVEAGAIKRVGDAGWLHRIGPSQQRFGSRSVHLTASEPQQPDFAELARRWADVGRPLLHQLAEQLGLPEPALQTFSTGWTREHWAWTFPMHDASGRVIGIRLRLPNGRKLSLRGSREGLFLPSELASAQPPVPLLVVTEGPTDAAAALALGFRHVAGRPSCGGGTKHLLELVHRLRPQRIGVISDNDNPGLEGAQRLAAALPHSDVRIVLPPAGHKDLRDAVRAGLTAEQLSQAIQSSGPVKLRISLKIRL